MKDRQTVTVLQEAESRISRKRQRDRGTAGLVRCIHGGIAHVDVQRLSASSGAKQVQELYLHDPHQEMSVQEQPDLVYEDDYEDMQKAIRQPLAHPRDQGALSQANEDADIKKATHRISRNPSRVILESWSWCRFNVCGTITCR